MGRITDVREVYTWLPEKVHFLTQTPSVATGQLRPRMSSKMSSELILRTNSFQKKDYQANNSNILNSELISSTHRTHFEDKLVSNTLSLKEMNLTAHAGGHAQSWSPVHYCRSIFIFYRISCIFLGMPKNLSFAVLISAVFAKFSDFIETILRCFWNIFRNIFCPGRKTSRFFFRSSVSGKFSSLSDEILDIVEKYIRIPLERP